jgi:hypothetical protein
VPQQQATEKTEQVDQAGVDAGGWHAFLIPLLYLLAGFLISFDRRSGQ